MSLIVEVAGKTDIGSVRKNNEDNLGWDERLGLYVVCDGMGGANAGEVASKMGVDLLLDYFRHGKQTGDFPAFGTFPPEISETGKHLSSAIQRANRAIFEQGQEKKAQQGMGTTIVSLLIQDNFVTIAHAGDSRIYRLRGGVFEQLTQDHSLVMEQVRRGLITLEQAEKSEMQNIIIRALGSEEAVEADVEDLVAVPGDILLMASDGLTRYVQDEEILEIVQRPGSLEQACGDLVKIAKERGGEDNITCLLVGVLSRPW